MGKSPKATYVVGGPGLDRPVTVSATNPNSAMYKAYKQAHKSLPKGLNGIRVAVVRGRS